MEVRVSSSVVCFLCSLKFKLRFVAVESIDENIAFRRIFNSISELIEESIQWYHYTIEFLHVGNYLLQYGRNCVNIRIIILQLYNSRGKRIGCYYKYIYFLLF